MEKIDLLSLQKNLSVLLEKELVGGKILLDKMSMLDETSRRAAAYSDPKYAPFYYHLGKFVTPKSLISFNFGLGLLESSFLVSCKTVEHFTGIRQPAPEYYSPRMGINNIKLNYKGTLYFYINNIYDDALVEKISPIKWDMVVINEEMTYDDHLAYLEFVWPYLNDNGIVVAEYIKRNESASNAFYAFGESVNRPPISFHTRYGTGILQK